MLPPPHRSDFGSLKREQSNAPDQQQSDSGASRTFSQPVQGPGLTPGGPTSGGIEESQRYANAWAKEANSDQRLADRARGYEARQNGDAALARADKLQAGLNKHQEQQPAQEPEIDQKER